MNEHIKSIVETQLKEFKKFDETNLDSLDSEDVYLKNIENNEEVELVSNQYLKEGCQIRLQFLLPYITKSIKKYAPINNGVILCLGDRINLSYNKNIPVLCFSKPKHLNAMLIPNVDFFTKTIAADLKIAKRDIPFYDKTDTSLFVGASTGDLNNNTRAKYSISHIGSHKHFSYLTSLCQHQESEWRERYPEIDSVVVDSYIPIKEQLKHKITINIDGNTICWSRLYWQMTSNSIPVYINRSKTEIQFFDYMENTDCYLDTSLEDYLKTYDYIIDPKNSEQISSVINNGKQYSNILFNDYLINPDQFLQEIIDNILQSFFSNQ